MAKALRLGELQNSENPWRSRISTRITQILDLQELSSSFR